MELPKYENSLLSVTGSILGYFGVPGGHPGLPLLDKQLAKQRPRNVVLMVMDGMGTAVLERHLPQDSFLRRYLASSVSSVFPPTTTAATTTLESGLSPIEHGWLGWSLYFPQIGEPVDIFTNELTYRQGTQAAFPAARTLLPYKTMYARIEEAGQARAFSLSPFSAVRCDTLGEICKALPEKLREGRNYAYCYCMEPDYSMHRLGTSVPEIKALIKEIDRSCAALAAVLTDTLLLITADHGHTHVKWRCIEDYPVLFEMIEIPPSLEPRAAAFFIKSGKQAEFRKRFEQEFSADFTLYSRSEALKIGLFGPGKPHPRVPGLLGDFIAIATGEYCLKYSYTPGQTDFLAHHAGLTAAELTVPLICVPCA